MMSLQRTISTMPTRRDRPLADVANTRYSRSSQTQTATQAYPGTTTFSKTPFASRRASQADSTGQQPTIHNLAVSDVQAAGTGTPTTTTLPGAPAKATTTGTSPAAPPAAVATRVASEPPTSVSATPQASPLVQSAAIAPAQGGAHSTEPAMASTPASRRISRASRSSARLTTAVPFPTISEETFDSMQCDPTPVPHYSYNSSTELARGREWEKEIARRQENIKELRDRKIRLEQAHSTRPRKRSPVPSYSHLTSTERKFSADDIEFISVLHSSVVWRLWHVDLSPEIFASERMLATRLHLILMRYGKKDIPVPPIVALSKSHLVAHGNGNANAMMRGVGGAFGAFSTAGGVMGAFGKPRVMMDKEKKGVQSLDQLVAKSLLRKGEGSSKGGPRRRRVVIVDAYDAGSAVGVRSGGSMGRGSANARRDATSPLARGSW